MNLKQRILTYLSSETSDVAEVEKITLAEETLVDGAVIVAESFEDGQSVFIKAVQVDGEESELDVPLPVGEYTFEDGRVLTVEVEGEIKSIVAPESESEEKEEEVKEEVEASTEDELAEDGEEGEVTEEEAVVEEITIDQLLEVIKSLTERIEGLEGKEEMAAQEAVKLSAEKDEEIRLAAEEDAKTKPNVHNPEGEAVRKVKFYIPKGGL